MTTLTLPLRRRGAQVLDAFFTGLEHGLRWARSRSRFVPGLAGAGLVCWGAALVYLPAGVILGGVFLLAMDRQIKLGRGG